MIEHALSYAKILASFYQKSTNLSWPNVLVCILQRTANVEQNKSCVTRLDSASPAAGSVMGRKTAQTVKTSSTVVCLHCLFSQNSVVLVRIYYYSSCVFT